MYFIASSAFITSLPISDIYLKTLNGISIPSDGLSLSPFSILAINVLKGFNSLFIIFYFVLLWHLSWPLNTINENYPIIDYKLLTLSDLDFEMCLRWNSGTHQVC
jgi:hypothetical protein